MHLSRRPSLTLSVSSAILVNDRAQAWFGMLRAVDHDDIDEPLLFPAGTAASQGDVHWDSGRFRK
jgi:hypothetical protein